MKKYLYSTVLIALGFVVFSGCLKWDSITGTKEPTATEQKGKTSSQTGDVPAAPGDTPKKENLKQGESAGIQKQKPAKKTSDKKEPIIKTPIEVE